jgi:O-antigen/teichoic acid export membrane protein
VLLVAGLPLALSGIFDSIVFYTDSVMLSALTGAVAVGLYNAALRPLAATLVLPAVLAAALLPRMSRDARSDRPALATALGHSLKLVAALALPVAAFVLPTAEGWIRLLFGAPYVTAAPAMGVLAFAVAAVYVTTLTGHALVAADRQVVHLRLAAMCATLNVGLNLLLIPRMGFTGAALAGLASHLFMLSAELRAVRDLVDLKLLVRPMLKLALSALMLFLAAHVMVMTVGATTPRLLLLVTPLSCAVYLLCVAALRVLDREEMAIVGGLLRRLARLGR